MHTTPRLGIQVPDATDAPDIPTHIGNVATAADGLAPVDQGTLASRPPSSPGTPGIEGRFYYVIGDSTPDNNGRLWYDFGTGWSEVGNADALLKTLINAKGDLLIGTADNTAARVAAAGVAGNVLVEDPATATGWKSAAPSGGGIGKGTAFPSTPSEGDMFIRTDLPGSPIFKYTNGAWELQPRMGAQTVPVTRLRKSANQSIPNDVETAVTFDTEDVDTDSMHDVAVNTTRITIKTPGVYNIEASVSFASSGGGSYRAAYLIKNGGGAGNVLARALFAPSSGAGTRVPVVANGVRLAAGDYVEVQALQNSGGALNADVDSRLSAIWAGGAGQTVDERGVPACKLVDNSSVNVVTATETALPFATELFDTDGSHDTAANTSRFTAKTPGLYQLEASVYWSDGSAGSFRQLYFKKNGVAGILDYAVNDESSVGSSGGGTTNQNISATVLLAAGDYVEAFVYQQTGSTLHITNRSFSAVMVGSGKTVTPYAKVYPSANAPAIVAGGNAFLSFDSETADNDGIHDTVTNNSRLTCRTAGIYLIRGYVNLTVGTGGEFQAHIYKNGRADSNIISQGKSGSGSGVLVTAIAELAVGDYVELRVYNGTGASITPQGGLISGGGPENANTYFTMVKIGAPIAGNTGVEPVEGYHIVGGAGEPAYQNGWTAESGNRIGFYKDRGRVFFDGQLTAATRTAHIAFTLPVAYRPAIGHVFYVYGQTAGAAEVRLKCEVNTDGTVYVRLPDDTAAPSNARWIDLSPVNFRL